MLNLALAVENPAFAQVHRISPNSQQVQMFRQELSRMSSTLRVQNSSDAVQVMHQVMQLGQRMGLPPGTVATEFVMGAAETLDKYSAFEPKSNETAADLEVPIGDNSSNAYFRQLFAAKIINSERIFWVEDAKVCNKAAPDDVTTKGGKVHAAECLKAGDCGWAYMTGLKVGDNVGRPQVLDAYLPGTTDFDKDTWDGKACVIFLDGSAQLIDLDPNGKLLHNEQDLLSAKAPIWEGAKVDPLKRLIQPLPTKAGEEGEDAAPQDPAE